MTASGEDAGRATRRNRRRPRGQLTPAPAVFGRPRPVKHADQSYRYCQQCGHTKARCRCVA